MYIFKIILYIVVGLAILVAIAFLALMWWLGYAEWKYWEKTGYAEHLMAKGAEWEAEQYRREHDK